MNLTVKLEGGANTLQQQFELPLVKAVSLYTAIVRLIERTIRENGEQTHDNRNPRG